MKLLCVSKQCCWPHSAETNRARVVLITPSQALTKETYEVSNG